MIKHIKEEMTISKCISILVLIALLILVITQKDSFYDQVTYIDGKTTETVPKSLKRDYYDIPGDTTISQDFTAHENRLQAIKIIFRNEARARPVDIWISVLQMTREALYMTTGLRCLRYLTENG